MFEKLGSIYWKSKRCENDLLFVYFFHVNFCSHKKKETTF